MTAMVTPAAWRAAGELIRWREHDVFVRTGGAGDALLLVHGFPTASWDWWPLWAGLTARHRVIACDLLGYGFSAKPRRHPYRIVDQVELLLAVLAHAGVARCRVLAHDYGVTVAQELLARRRDGTLPVTIDALCLLNGGLFPEVHRPLRTQKLLASRLGPLLVRFTGKRRFAASMRAIWGARPVPDAELDAMWELVARDGGVRVLPPLLDYIAQRRANRERWVGALTDPAIASGPTRLPIRYVCGMKDPISGAHMAARYRELVPSPDVVELAGVGHYPQLEAPAAVLEAALALFAR
jgi:pimeloyl-ACP methyl ester carboxylesterase